MKTVVRVPDLVSYDKIGFSQCVTLKELVFVAGQTGIDADGAVVSEDIQAQATQTIGNIERALRAAGSDLSHILAMTCYIVDIVKHGPPFWAVRKRLMPDTGYTSASIGVAGLFDPRLLLEIQCIAYRSRS